MNLAKNSLISGQKEVFMNLGIIASLCDDCMRKGSDKPYLKGEIASVIIGAMQILVEQAEAELICQCVFENERKTLECLGNLCVFCNGKDGLVKTEALNYINKKKPSDGERKNAIAEVAGKNFGNKVTNITEVREKISKK